MLPREVYERLLGEKGLLGLKMLYDGTKRVFFWQVETIEGPNDLMDYSLGTASAQATAGTGWSEITDSQGRYHVEPEFEKIIYHIFIGISPGQAWLYRRYPSNKDINNLLGTRAIGSGIGHIDGLKSPYRAPSPTTEFFTIKSLHPSFLGYAPYLEPTSIIVRLNFFVTRYDVRFLGIDPSGSEDADSKMVIAPADVRDRAKVRTMGGHELMDAPTWVTQLLRK